MIRKILARLAGDLTSPPSSQGTVGTVLLVDDDPDLRQLLKLAFESKGYVVRLAENGVEGVKNALQSPPDAIVLDANMPVLDGFETLKHLRKDRRTASIPVVMLTRRSKQGDVVAGYRYGAQVYLTKPVTIEEVLASVKELTKARAPG